jgi:hypothetical protein
MVPVLAEDAGIAVSKLGHGPVQVNELW